MIGFSLQCNYSILESGPFSLPMVETWEWEPQIVEGLNNHYSYFAVWSHGNKISIIPRLA